MKLSRTTALVITLFFSHTLSAADARFCDKYAKTSIKQQMVNVVASCKQKGIRWSVLHTGQFRWCRTVRESVANKETKFRNDALAQCGVSINENLWENVWEIIENHGRSLEIVRTNMGNNRK